MPSFSSTRSFMRETWGWGGVGVSGGLLGGMMWGWVGMGYLVLGLDVELDLFAG